MADTNTPEFDIEVRRQVIAVQTTEKCTCDAQTIQPQHPKKCDLWKNEEWKAGEAEWDPESDQLLYYYKEGSIYWLTDFDQVWIDSEAALPSATDEDDEEDFEGECVCLPPKRWRCAVCKVKRDKEADPWGPIRPWDSFDWTTYSPCRHAMKEIALPDGVKVFASSHHRTRDKDEVRPEFGMYLDGIWDSDCLSYHVPWTDHGLPDISYEQTAIAIKAVYDYAKEGRAIEVGCIGGHGRTGTVIACFAIIAGVKAKNAVKWVRKNYCDNAIESELQEWFPLWFNAWLNGSTPPEKPVVIPWVTTYKASSTTTPTNPTTTTTNAPVKTVYSSGKTEGQKHEHRCSACNQPMALDLTREDVRRFRCIRPMCDLGLVNIGKEELNDNDGGISRPIKQYLAQGNFLLASVVAGFGRYDNWPGTLYVQSEFIRAEKPLTYEEAIKRATDRSRNRAHDERIKEIAAEIGAFAGDYEAF